MTCLEKEQHLAFSLQKMEICVLKCFIYLKDAEERTLPLIFLNQESYDKLASLTYKLLTIFSYSSPAI